MNFIEAAKLLNVGKKVRRSNWRKNSFLHDPENDTVIHRTLDDNEGDSKSNFGVTEILADDWMLYEEEKKEKVYILQKDLPDGKAGDTYVYAKSGGSYAYFKDGNPDTPHWFFSENVENNPEWFLPEKQPKKEVAEKSLMETAYDKYKEGFLDRITCSGTPTFFTVWAEAWIAAQNHYEK